MVVGNIRLTKPGCKMLYLHKIFADPCSFESGEAMKVLPLSDICFVEIDTLCTDIQESLDWMYEKLVISQFRYILDDKCLIFIWNIDRRFHRVSIQDVLKDFCDLCEVDLLFNAFTFCEGNYVVYIF